MGDGHGGGIYRDEQWVSYVSESIPEAKSTLYTLYVCGRVPSLREGKQTNKQTKTKLKETWLYVYMTASLTTLERKTT